MSKQSTQKVAMNSIHCGLPLQPDINTEMYIWLLGVKRCVAIAALVNAEILHILGYISYKIGYYNNH